MAAAILDLVGANAIEQGSLWEGQIIYPGNLTGARHKGQIKKDYSSKVIAEFRFGVGVYSAELDETSFDWFLPSLTTKNLPIPEEGKHFVYDVVVYLLNQNEPRRQLQGIVDVSPGSTET